MPQTNVPLLMRYHLLTRLLTLTNKIRREKHQDREKDRDPESVTREGDLEVLLNDDENS